MKLVGIYLSIYLGVTVDICVNIYIYTYILKHEVSSNITKHCKKSCTQRYTLDTNEMEHRQLKRNRENTNNVWQELVLTDLFNSQLLANFVFREKT